MIEFLLSIKKPKELAITCGVKEFEQVDLDGYQKRYDEIVGVGFEVLERSTIHKKSSENDAEAWLALKYLLI